MTRHLTERSLVLASHNSGKLVEIRELLSPYGFEIKSVADYGLPEPIEDGTSFEENAYKKAIVAAQESGEVALSDDSGICVDALDGAPGIHTADWAETPDGTRDFYLAMQKVQDKLQAIESCNESSNRRAFFCAVLCLCWPDGESQYFRGEVHGDLVWPPRGDLGFGYDPVFKPDGYDCTFGEMTSEEKHGWRDGDPLSHRSRAFAQLVHQHLR